jgi:AraC-like DNA-binding protein
MKREPAPPSSARLERYRKLIAEFERATCAAAAVPPSVAAFCAAAGISERTLLRAVRAVHGVSVHRHLQAVRLAQARTMLGSMDAKTTTVTQIAMRCGFLELGRFSRLYRNAFGESPSETLNRTPRACELDRPTSDGRDVGLGLAQSLLREREQV